MRPCRTVRRRSPFVAVTGQFFVSADTLFLQQRGTQLVVDTRPLTEYPAHELNCYPWWETSQPTCSTSPSARGSESKHAVDAKVPKEADQP